jgi:hypothetical protein
MSDDERIPDRNVSNTPLAYLPMIIVGEPKFLAHMSVSEKISDE